jgi:Icc-related predicted phosphoesterase
MKFALGSDMHLDFGGFDILPRKVEGVDTLVLAGDTVEVELLKKDSGLRTKVVDYFKELNDNFKTVIYIMGNHEHYGNSFIHTEQNLRTQFAKAGLTNFVVLEKTTIEVEDVIFFGATMWTTCRNGNPLIMNAVQSGMNDYHYIHVGPGAWGDTIRLTTSDTAAVCVRTKKKIQEFADLKTDKKKVLITHMAPCELSIPQRFKNSVMTDAYYEDITDILFDSDIHVAVHGHVHDNLYYTVGETLVVANPRGYYGSEPSANCFEFQTVNV